MKLSVVVITFNEEKNIKRFIESVHNISDEIVIVDSFSTDNTAKICQSFTKVKFLQHPFEGYGIQKNWALSQCSGEWILFLDADEILDQKAKDHIINIISQPADFYVYKIKFQNIFLNKILKYGGWGKVYRERFFKKGHGKYNNAEVHESFLTQDTVGTLKGHLNHFTYRDIHHHIEKMNKYTSMMAKQMHKMGKSVNMFKLIFSPFFQFIKSYILQKGFLDGIVGFYIAISSAFYTFLKYIKLYECSKK